MGHNPNLYLHWFGLTEGFYRLQVGSSYLFNASDEYVDYRARNFSDAYCGSSVDYYVVRLWEDLLEMLPDVLEPIPTELHPFLETDYAVWSSWYDKTVDWMDSKTELSLDEDQMFELWSVATAWRTNRHLHTGYLTHAPKIWLWSTDSTVIISWDNQGITVEGIPVWSATRGTYCLSRSEFSNEVHAFHHRLIGEMGERVDAVCTNWNHTGIRVDTAQLRHEQSNRAEWLKHALQKAPLQKAPSLHAWNRVLDSISTMSISFPS